MKDYDKKLGVVIARRENLWRLDIYGLKRAEFVVFAPEDRDALLEFIAGRDLRYSIHSPLYAPPDYPENPLLACIIDPDEERRRLAVALMLENITFAEEMGAEFVVVHTQRPEQFAGAPPGGFTERDAMDAACRSAEVLSEKSVRAGVPVLIENIMDNSGFYRAEQYLELLEKFPPLGFCLDIGHLDVDVRRFGIDFREFVRTLAPRTREVHLQNSTEPANSTAQRPWKIPVHPSQTPEAGWCDIEAVLRDVLAARPDCVVNFEFRPDKNQGENFILEGMDWVRRILAALPD